MPSVGSEESTKYGKEHVTLTLPRKIEQHDDDNKEEGILHFLRRGLHQQKKPQMSVEKST